MINQWIVPKWNLKQQRKEQVEGRSRETNTSNRSSHVHPHLQNHLVPIPMSNDYEIAELTWENGQIAMHGLSGLLHSSQRKPTWGGAAGRTSETLESIVQQATTHQKHHHYHLKEKEEEDVEEEDSEIPEKMAASAVTPSNGKWGAETSSMGQQVEEMGPILMKKRTRSESNYQCGSSRGDSEQVDRSACASGSAAYCRESDGTMMTFPSFESPPSFKPKPSDHEDSVSHGGGSENQDEDRKTKTETVRSHSSRRSRAAAIHNQSERKRRDRINQKMKALQKLVPNASKTDKASMLDEVIEYLKQLQAQVQVMSVSRNMPHMNMMMPIGMQHHLHQMSLLARMGMATGLGMGMGMLDINSMSHTSPQSLLQLLHHHPPQVSTTTTSATSTFLPPPPPSPPFVVPDHPAASTHCPIPLPDPYCNFLTQQSMNMELYNKMAALYRQQVNQTTQATSNLSQQSNHMQGN